jgi:hypothetical protein
MRKVRATVLLSTIAVCILLAVIWRTASRKPNRNSPPDQCTPEASTLSEAWATLASLVPVSAKDMPQWESESWSDKCQLNLEACPDERVPTIQDLFGNHDPEWLNEHASEIRGVTILRNSLRLPVQLADTQSSKADNGPRFAAVLFNQQAADSVREAEQELTSGGKVEFQQGSMIAKVIWNIISIKNGKSEPQLPMWVTKVMDAHGEQMFPPDAFSPPSPATTDYWTSYSIDTNVKDSSGGCTPDTAVVPLDCIHWYEFSAMPGSPGSTIIAAMLKESVRHTFRTVYQYCSDDDCMLVLMGIHIMKRLDDSDPASQGGKYHWLFMTFWWTGQDNHQNLPEPWKYYQVNATQLPRNDNAVACRHNVCFNPYLESVQSAGPQSNCVNCHTYAAWNPATGHDSPVRKGASESLGAAPIGVKINPIVADCYAHKYRPTDFVWSLAGYASENSSRPH